MNPEEPVVSAEPSNSGFTLIELSIVLVIIGLITSGILVGRDLIKASERRTVIAEFTEYRSAVNAFKDKYISVPGDMMNATFFFGKDNTNCSGNTGTAATPGTCNGNGNNLIEWASAPSATGEFTQFWKQLALAGLISGTYSGLAGTYSNSSCVVNTGSCPVSKFANANWSTNTISVVTPSNSILYLLDYGNVLDLQSQNLSGGVSGPVMTPSDAFAIDSKLDDGKPASGMVVGVFWNNLCSVNNSGTLSNTNLDASYRVTDETIQCRLIFRKAY